MAKYLDPKNDIVFKKIFGQHPHLLISFLNSQLTFKDGSIIESIEYLKDELVPDSPLKRRSVVDVRCTDNLKRQFIVEMQMEWAEAFLERMLFNTAAIYSRQLKKGSSYLHLQPVYGLAILNDTFYKETDEYYHAFEMTNPRDPKETIEGMNIVFIELPKLAPKTHEEKKLAVLWLRFLKETEDGVKDIPQEFKENELIKEALDLCEEAAYTDAERYAYDRLWDEVSRENTLIEAKFAEGLAEGEVIGFEKGRVEGRIESEKAKKALAEEIALNLYRAGVPVELISGSIKLSVNEITELINKLK
ncbi:MAG: Rpn family recombination-promoting nuclease/putative transposase [Tannerella sp.]|nr:Rpn family recombination-promoting nuclease/putative transposase [Tannerella sp.]